MTDTNPTIAVRDWGMVLEREIRVGDHAIVSRVYLPSLFTEAQLDTGLKTLGLIPKE